MGRTVQSGAYLATTSWSTVITMSPSMVAGSALLTVTGYIGNGDSGAIRTATVKLTRDGADLGVPVAYYLPYQAGGTYGQPVSITAEIAAETAGSHTYALQTIASAGSAVALQSCRIAVTQGDLGL